jgi:hypothetical protein
MMKPEIIDKNNVLTKKIGKYLPIILLEVFLNVGYILYRISPWKFPFRNDIRTLVFILLVDLFLLIGYLVAVKSKNIIYTSSFDIKSYYYIALICAAVFFIPTCYYKTGYIFPPVIETFTNYGATYAKILNKIQNRQDIGLFTNVIGAFYWASYILFPLTYYYWEKLKLRDKILGIILLTGYLLIELCTGKNLGTVILALTIVLLYFAKVFHPDFKFLCKKGFALTGFTILILISIALLFNTNLSARTGYTASNEEVYAAKTEVAKETISTDVANENTSSELDILDEQTKDYIVTIGDPIAGSVFHGSLILPKTDFGKEKLKNDYKYFSPALSDYYLVPGIYGYVHIDDPIYNSLPEKLRFFYAYGSFYLSHGYTGLSIALYQPWDSTFGLSSLKFVDYYLSKFIDTSSITSKSYEAKLISGGWNVGNYWMTVYPQFASDLSWPGTILLMGIFGLLLGVLWIEVIYGKNIIAILFFPFYCIQFFFFTSWWYAGLTGGYFVLFYGLFFLWIFVKLLSRRKLHMQK